MATGTVKWFDFKKCFGFISPDSGGRDVFVHVSALNAAGIKSLPEGTRLSYELGTNNGKTTAVNLKLGA